MKSLDPQLDEEIACVRREIRQREYVYPRFVAEGRMSRQKADHELATMKRVLARLEALKAPDLLGAR